MCIYSLYSFFIRPWFLLFLFLFFTPVFFFQESWGTIQVCMGKAEAEDEDDVNGWITLGFALGGVGFDLMCLLEFYKSNKKLDSAKVKVQRETKFFYFFVVVPFSANCNLELRINSLNLEGLAFTSCVLFQKIRVPTTS